MKEFRLQQKEKRQSKFMADATKSKSTDFKAVKFKSEKDAEKDFIEFVGFRGYPDPEGYPIIDLTHTVEITVNENNEPITVKKFAYEYHPGQAYPPPIDEKGTELGILPHEVEAYRKIRKYLKKGIMLEWPRGYGKSWVFTYIIEWTMLRLGYPWLYLSETAIMNDVAYWIWQWATNSKLIIDTHKGDKQQTYTSFELTTGAVLRIFEFMDEAVTGQHGYYVAMDDIIKKGWSDRPSDNERAKRQYNYVIRYIRKMGLMICGTRKFDGDPLQHIQKTEKHLYVDVRTPYIMEGKYPDWSIKYDENGLEILWVPELYTHEELEDKKTTIGEEDGIDPIIAWNAEMMQDTRPGAGGLCEKADIYYTKRPLFSQGVQMVGIGCDLSWEEEKRTSDMCAIVSCVMHEIEVDKRWYKRFTFIISDVSRMPLYDGKDINGNFVKGVYTVINEHYQFIKRNYPYIPLIIAIERNSGGTIIIKVAKREYAINPEHFEWYRYIIPDRKTPVKSPSTGTATNLQLGIYHPKNKTARIFGELQNSIKEHKDHAGHEVQFVWELEGCTLIQQMTGFPKMKHDDGPDAAGMIKDELNARYKVHPKPNIPYEVRKEMKRINKAQESFKELQYPFLKEQKRLKKREKYKGGRL